MKKLIVIALVALVALTYVCVKYNNASKRLEEQEKRIEFGRKWNEKHPEMDTIPQSEYEPTKF